MHVYQHMCMMQYVHIEHQLNSTKLGRTLQLMYILEKELSADLKNVVSFRAGSRHDLFIW